MLQLRNSSDNFITANEHNRNISHLQSSMSMNQQMHQEHSGHAYKTSNGSPLRKPSPKRGMDTYERTHHQTQNVTQVTSSKHIESNHEQ